MSVPECILMESEMSDVGYAACKKTHKTKRWLFLGLHNQQSEQRWRDERKKLKWGEGGRQASPRVKVNVHRNTSEGECCITQSRSCVGNQRSGRSELKRTGSELVNMTAHRPLKTATGTKDFLARVLWGGVFWSSAVPVA